MDDVIVKKKKSSIFGFAVYAARNFKKGEIVIKYNLKALNALEFQRLPKTEKPFTHTHWGVIYLYSSPERYVNHSLNPNTLPNLKHKCDIAMKDIKQGEEITTDSTKDDIS
ncbi:MAG: hypothetical protein A2729_03550 [Candidatus Buchananbacteria bacterium RIFCSPHIGHO2_01_FULL_39_14]|uniref:SET domain-containing protein n=1 Tax=Candidatus Buchananbacteria bacterium RIFCSPHIGHO2_01_FULL_39_14 TaxID=1797532 RepID=A0A1G1XYG8_9BACT|nr:MAG: hypothetical protein A2729_03550 [Candidatus Buchananbacteria bacterium RIFCSPHIGHO2_01_FULL_39_14]